MRITREFVVVFVLILATAALPASGQTLMPIDQFRGGSAFVIVPPCGGDLADAVEAPDFGPFEATAEAELGCGVALGTAKAGHRSQIRAQSLRARGGTHSSADTDIPEVLHAIATSTFDVAFELDLPAAVGLRGKIRAKSSSEFALGGVAVTLFGPDGQPLVEHLVEPGDGGAPRVESFKQIGNLDAGLYRLLVTGASLIDNQNPVDMFVTTTYDVEFVVFQDS